VANVSHELRTPLTSIQGFTETLLTNDVDEVQQKSFLKIIQDQSARLSTVLEDLLSLSKLEKDSEGVETTPQKIGPVVQTAIQVCEPKAKKLHVDFEFEGDDQIIVNINSLLFEQALVNLIDNAIKYGRPQDGKNKGSVKVKIDQDDQSVRVSVIDQGKGIDNEHLSRLFERFYRVDKARSRNIGGTGLGLSIVKHIALAHKGSVKVESQLGQGSKFSIILPKNHELT
ncbi:MAG: ATP-binding protein, partial [Bdellovibrionales bacterium]|nr:ATP-binding protein [Bdellovibrionales bacterium]